MGQQILEGDEDMLMLLSAVDKSWHPNSHGNLDSIQKGFTIIGFTGNHQKIEGKIGNEGKRMSEIYPLGSEERINIFVKILIPSSEYLLKWIPSLASSVTSSRSSS